MKNSYPNRFVLLRATWLFERSKLRNSTIAQKLDFGEPLVWHMFFHHFLTLNHMATSVFQFDWNLSKCRPKIRLFLVKKSLFLNRYEFLGNFIQFKHDHAVSFYF